MNSLSDIMATSSFNNLQQSDPQTPTTPKDGFFDPLISPTLQSPSMQTSGAQLIPMIHAMKDQLDAMLRMLQGEATMPVLRFNTTNVPTVDTGENIIEGVFNGEKMVGADGKEYSVPPNYASKSKLVEGDMMKLTITVHGSFIYKQTGRIDRARLVGELVGDSATGHWSAICEGKIYKILTASITFYKGRVGDEVVFLVPRDGSSQWGAVENIISRGTQGGGFSVKAY